MTHSTSELNIQQAIDDSKFSLFHWTLIILGFLILAIDGFDTAAMGYIAPSVAKDWGIVTPARHRLPPGDPPGSRRRRRCGRARRCRNAPRPR